MGVTRHGSYPGVFHCSGWTSAVRGGAANRSYHLVVNAQERVRRDAEVVAARARGLSWPTIAAQFHLSERQCRRIVREYRAEAEAEAFDAASAVRDALEAHDAAIEELALLAEQTNHDGAKLGAIRARLDAIRSRWELMRAIGLLPANLGQLWSEFDAEMVSREIVAVLDKHEIAADVRREISDTSSSGILTPRTPTRQQS